MTDDLLFQPLAVGDLDLEHRAFMAPLPASQLSATPPECARFRSWARIGTHPGTATTVELSGA